VAIMQTKKVALFWAMMLLQYAIWGAWAVTVGKYMGDPPPQGLGIRGATQGLIFAMLPLASIIMPPIMGQLADRKVNTEKLLAALHLVGGFAMFGLAMVKDIGSFAALMGLFSLCYAPTLSLTNSIVFANLTDSEKEFGLIRVAGTIGWIIAGWLLSGLQNAMPTMTNVHFLLAGGFSILLGLFSFALPKTPPSASSDPFAFMKAVSLLKDRSFLVFMICAFVVGTELEFYYLHTSSFLGASVDMKGVGVEGKNIAAVMSLGQLAEIVVMLALPLFIKWLGLRRTILIGIIAWPIRYLIFTLAPGSDFARSLVVPSLALHGFCYVFFFVAGFIYVDQISPKEIKASAQALIALVVLGLGRFVGSLVAGFVQGAYTIPSTVKGEPDFVHWDKVFLVPTVLTVVAAVLFPLLFKGTNRKDVDTNIHVASG
jgi:nucleoside transporter